MTTFKDIEDKTLDTSYDGLVAMSERFQKAQQSVDWNDHPYLSMTDAVKASRNPVNRTYGAESLLEVKSDAGTIAWDTFRKGVLDLASLPDKAEMALGNTLAGLTGDRVGTEMRDRAYDSLMKTMEDSRFIDSNYGDAETWTARFTGGAMSMGEMLAIGALTGPVGLGAFVGTTSLSDGALNDMANYYAEHGNLDGYETDPVNLAMDYGNAIFQVGSEMIGGTGRLLNGRVLKAGSAMGAVVKETVSNFTQESLQGLAADATEVLKGNEDVNILLENAGGYIKDGIVGGVLGGVTGGTFYRVNKGRGKGSIKEVLRKLYPQKNEKELDDGAEEIWAKTEEKGLKTFVPEIVAHTEAVNDKGKIREIVRQKVAMVYADEDMSEKERAKAIEATTTLELENILYDSIERKVPLTAHPLVQGEVNELGWFRAGIPEHRRTEIDALNKELVDLKAQQKELMSAQEKDYNKLEEIETKIEQFRKNLLEKVGDLVVADKEQVRQMLKVQRNRVGDLMSKKQVLQSIKERARKASEKQDKADTALAEKMATGAEKAREQRVKKETAEQTKEAKVRTLTEQREITSAIKSVKVAVKERKQAQNRELRYAIEQATDESLRNVLKNRKWNAYTVDNMKRRELVAEVKQIPNLSMLELVPMSRRDISYQQEMAESKQEKTKTAKGFFHRKINRDFANESGILQAWGYSKDDSAINLVFVKDGGLADWDAIVMELQDNGYLPQTYARTYEETDALVDQAKDIVLNNKELTESMGDMTQSQVDYTADRGEELLLDAGYTPEQIQAMSFQEMSDILSKLYAEDVAQQELTEEQVAQIPDDWMAQSPALKESFDIADENARLDEVNPEYTGETIEVNGVERTVYNSNGERIAKSEPALRNFWNWFGDSKVVDEDGRPLVVYHGSDVSGIEVFDNQANQTKQRQIGAEKGYFFTDSKKVAERFRTPEQRKAESKYYTENTVREPVTEEKYDAQGRYLGSVHYAKTTLPEYKNFGLYPVYLKAESVNEYDGEDIGVGVERETALESAKQSGKDGVIIYNADTGAGIANEYIVFEPNQIKSTQNRGTFSSDAGNIYFQKAYAGSRVDYDKPSLEALGTGEGAQAHGWGLYYALNPEIAERYRQAFTGDYVERVDYKGKDIPLDYSLSYDQKENAIYNVRLQMSNNNFDSKAAIASLIKSERHNLETLEKSFQDPETQNEEKLANHYKRRIEATKDLIKAYESLNPADFKKHEYGQVHEVDIPEMDVLLDEQKTFDEQSEFVKEKLEEISGKEYTNFMTAILNGKTGEELYNALVIDIDNRYENLDKRFEKGDSAKKQASLLLEKHGIKGITYDGREDGRCFVIFNDKDVKVLRKKFDKLGNMMFQTKATGKGKDVRGAFVPEYRFIAKTGNLDASTLAHELAHDWGQENFRWARSGKASEEFMRAWGAVEKAIGITDKDIYFTYDASEKFARAYEGWLLERKDWADILHINTDEEKKAVEEAMEDYRKELVDIYESLTNPYFTMAWGKTGELKPELKEWFERSTKYDELDNKVARGEITEEQASGQKLQDMLESATESTIDGIPVKDKNAIQAIEDLDKLREQEKRFETEGGNTNRIQRRLNAIALAKDMVANNEALGKYDTHRDMLAVAEAADIFVNTRLNDALAIINGKMPEQDGLYASDLYTALERKAKAENDFELVEELRNSLVAKQLAKELGQRVAGFRNYTASGDVDIMSTLKSLDKLYDKAYNEKEREQLEEDVKAYFESVAVADSQLDLDGFFNELECK